MKKFLKVFVLTLLFIIALPISVFADSGPKPSLTIIIRGMGEQQYYLDLLVSGEPKYMWLKISDEERKKVSKLAEYNKDGLHAALLKGTAIPMNGSITGEKQPDGSYIHKFSYVGVPKEFKIAILKSDGTLIISDTIKRTEFQSVMEYNVKDKTIKEMYSKKSQVKGFLFRLTAALIIETLIAFMFGFSVKKYWKIIFAANAVTQIILNILIFYMPEISPGISVIIPYTLGEVLAVFIELAVYCRFLTQHKLQRRILYTVTANLASFLIGFVLQYLP